MKEVLKKALFYNDLERVKEIMESPNFPKEWLVDCGDFDGEPTPIYYISQLWNEILPGYWSHCQEAVDGNRAKLEEIMSYIEERFQISVRAFVDLENYTNFFCDGESWWEDDDFKLSGFREIDKLLYRAAERYDFVETERLLQLGARDDIRIEECDPESSIVEQMYDDFLEREWWQTATLWPNTNYEAIKFEDIMILALFESIAKERMVKLMNKYFELNNGRPRGIGDRYVNGCEKALEKDEKANRRL